jgi:hypothetical protein
MGYNLKLVKESVGVGTRYRYFCQGEDPWCQVYSARWLRWKAKGKDMMGTALELEFAPRINLGVRPTQPSAPDVAITSTRQPKTTTASKSH